MAKEIEFKYGHTLYQVTDPDAPAQTVAHGADICRTCGRAEADLDAPCPGENTISIDEGGPRVRLKWYTPQGDKMVAHMARVSNPKATPDDPAERLIGYLIRNHHWSPFEMVNLCLEIHTERDISAQILRHSKEFRFQEFSTRYAEVEDLRWSTECRFQDAKNRQNSLAASSGEDGETSQWFTGIVYHQRETSLQRYREALERGVAKECARRILPIGLMPTVMYINSNLRGWIHYLAERTKPGVQKEHREIALAVEPIFAQCFPLVWKAVLEYRAQTERKDFAAANWLKIEELLKRHDTILLSPMGDGTGWALNNGKFEWNEL